jgi:hypothetical protein
VRARRRARADKPDRQRGDLRGGLGIGGRLGGRGRRGGVDPTGKGAEHVRNYLEPRRRGAREEQECVDDSTDLCGGLGCSGQVVGREGSSRGAGPPLVRRVVGRLAGGSCRSARHVAPGGGRA